MNKKVHMTSWSKDGDKIKLRYEDGDILYVNTNDFNRAFGCIVNATKDDIIRDFAIKKEGDKNEVKCKIYK